MTATKRKKSGGNRKFARQEHEKLHALLAQVRDMLDPALLNFGTDKALEFFAGVGAKANPILNDAGRPLRWQNQLIIEKVTPNASVLDLGCGDGELLKELTEQKNIRGQGVELDASAAIACIKRGVAVFQSDILTALQDMPDQSYDYVVLEETLQTLNRPDLVMQEMLRVGKIGIVSFPNFAFWQVRLDFVIRGRMPRTGWLPYMWFDTPNIHNLTLQDFIDWAELQAVKICDGYVLTRGKIRQLTAGDNLYAEEAVVLLEKLPPRIGKKIAGGKTQKSPIKENQ